VPEEETFNLISLQKIIVDKADSAAIKVAKYFQEMSKLKGLNGVVEYCKTHLQQQRYILSRVDVNDSLGSEV
jgi:hypothetical protein